MYRDRIDAGRRLAGRLEAYRAEHPVVLGLPRGGVVVAYEIARALGAPLDVLVARKLGAPGRPELGIGAVVDGDHPEAVVDERLAKAIGVSPAYLEREIARQLEEVRRRETRLRAGRARVDLRDRTVIVVDDGIATGGTVRAALRGVRRAQPRRVVLAVPVAPPTAVSALARDADAIVCLETPRNFHAVGQFYENFAQTTDDDVIALLARAASTPAGDADPPAGKVDSGRNVSSCTALAFVLTLALVAPAVADAFVGSGVLAGTARLVVKRCGTARSALAATVVIRSDGTWQSTDESGDAFGGTTTPVGKGDRKLSLAFDGATMADLVASIAEDVATVCETSAVTVTSVQPKTFVLTLNRTRTKAKLVLRYVFKGTAEGRSGSATYKVLGRGPWTAQ